tara:strand:+ start:1283 stop:1825 length:543 start_codon:yes stop_codon:yes gene_type:complete
MTLFAVTGITLNHAGQIEAHPVTTSIEEPVPDEVLAAVRASVAEAGVEPGPLPAALGRWLEDRSIRIRGREVEWSPDEIYISMPRPGGDAWLSIDLAAGEFIYESTDRGLVSWLNDLHKGRNTGKAWQWFIDVFSVACLVFCATGLWLLARHSGARAATWPVVGLGVVAPLLLILLFMHR